MQLRLTAVAALCMMLALSGTALAKGAGDAAQEAHPRGIVRMLDSLDLTPVQKHEVARILKNGREQTKPLREAMQTAFAKLREVMDKTPGDEAAVRGAAKAMADAGVELAVARGKLKAAVDAVLTPEQRAKREALRAEFKEKFKERKEQRLHDLDAWIEQNQS